MLRSLLLASCICSLAACGGDDDDDGPTFDAAAGSPDARVSTGPDAMATAAHNFTLELNGYGQAHNGDTLHFALWDDADTSAARASTTHLIQSGGGGGGGGGGNNDILFADALQDGHSYTLFWYADINGNESCDMGSDHHWSLAVSNATAAVSTPHQHTATFNGDCTKH